MIRLPSPKQLLKLAPLPARIFLRGLGFARAGLGELRGFTVRRLLLALRNALALNLAGAVLMVGVALLLADPRAGKRFAVIRFDDPATLMGSGETGHTAPSVDPQLAPFAERSPFGPLPRIAADGRLPARDFARTASATSGHPVISILVTGLGLDDAATRDALMKLPGSVTLGFSPYSPRLPAYTQAARRLHREYLLEIPVEPFDYPDSDPGPLVLLADAAPLANIERLHRAFSRATGYFGIVTSGASRFATAENAISTVAQEAAARGLALLDDGAAPVSKTARLAREKGAIAAMADRRLDLRPTDEGFALALLDLERLAVEQGHAVGATALYPVVLRRLADWAASLPGKGLVLAPVSFQILPPEPQHKDAHRS